MTMKRIIILSIILLTGCSEKETVTFGFQVYEALPATLERLDEDNIWYEKLKDGKYKFYKKDLGKISKIHGEEVNKIIPPYRSVHYHPDILSIIEKKLKTEDIPYKIVQAEGLPYLVWEEKNEEEVKRIAEEAYKEASKKWLQEK